MLKSISQNYTAFSGFQQALGISAHNLANVDTVAFKEQQYSFHELAYRQLEERRLPRAGAPPTPPRSGKGTALFSAVESRVQGALFSTERNKDLAVKGEGYFRVIRPDGSYGYTRRGDFMLDQEGNLVLYGGELLDPPLNLSQLEDEIDLSTLTITAEGNIFARALAAELEEEVEETEETTGDEAIAPEAPEGQLPPDIIELGQLMLYRFVNPQSLFDVGGNVFMPSAASGPPEEGVPGEDSFGEIRQGYLERSNVDLAQQMTSLIRGQRFLQASARAMVTADEMWALTLNLQA